jgi:hypothetical protein
VREIRTPGSMSGEEKRRDGLLGERGHERRRALLAPPVLHATALLLDSTHNVTRAKSWLQIVDGLRLTKMAENMAGRQGVFRADSSIEKVR